MTYILENFFRNSVVSIVIITFIIAITLVDRYLMALVLGLILSGVLNYSIKYTLDLICDNTTRRYFLRPINAKGCGACCQETPANNKIGFPSGHSQIVWFFSFYLILYSYYKLSYNIPSIIILIFFATSVSISRLGWLGNQCHTPGQVIAGTLLGCYTSYYYFYLVKSVLMVINF